MIQNQKWAVRKKPDRQRVSHLANELGLRSLVVELLLQRGMDDPEEIVRFLHPRLQDLSDPFLMPQMRQAVDRIFQAIDGKQSVVIYGDYDVDGVTSVTLMHAFFRAYGLEAQTFLPHRMDEGYGLNEHGIERCLAEFSPDLLIAVDCGTSSVEQVRYLRERGIDVIVCDHHECNTPENLPPAVALVNAKLGDNYHYLCTAGVMFKVGHAMLKERKIPNLNLRQWLDIVALGTVADLVPLVGENRTLVRKGLQQMDATIHPGLNALKNVAGVAARPVAYDIGFKLGPRLNAAGRLDTAQAALDLLMSDDHETARELATFLDGQNRERQDLEGRIKDEATEMLADFDAKRDFGIVLGHETWHPGVVGIVASRIVKQFHRPTFIIAFDEDGIGKGSGRSIEGVSLVAALNSCRELLLAGGGHEMAAGVSLERENVDAFRQNFCDYIRQHATPENLRPRVDIDLVATFEQLNLDLLDSYELVHPMGMGNPAPLMMSRAVQVSDEPRVLKEKHLKLPLFQSGRKIDAMLFNGADEKLPRTPWDVAYRISRNVYKGRSSLSVVVEALRTAV